MRHAGRLVFQLAEVLRHVSREMLGGILGLGIGAAASRIHLERIGRLRLAPG